jgi:hypothetical protein
MKRNKSAYPGPMITLIYVRYSFGHRRCLESSEARYVWAGHQTPFRQKARSQKDPKRTPKMSGDKFCTKRRHSLPNLVKIGVNLLRWERKSRSQITFPDAEGPKSTIFGPDTPQQILGKSDLTSIRVIMGPATTLHLASY